MAWLEPYNGDAQEETGYSALMASVDTLLMGRNSYDTVLAFPEWFYGDKPVVVLTHRPAAPREHVSFRQGGAGAGAGRAVAGGQPPSLSGWRRGGQAGTAGRAGGRADPVLGAGHLGGGVSLFAGSLPGALVPVSSTVLPSGLVRVVYQPA